MAVNIKRVNRIKDGSFVDPKKVENIKIRKEFIRLPDKDAAYISKLVFYPNLKQ